MKNNSLFQFVKALLFFCLLCYSHSIFSQLDMEMGQVKYSVKTAEPTTFENEMSYNIQFSELGTMFTIEASRGMVQFRYFYPPDATVKEPIFLINFIGKQYQLTDLPESEKNQSAVFLDARSFKKIKYRKGKKKTVSGYKCFRADVVTNDDRKLTMYLTKTIQPFARQKSSSVKPLKGFPMEVIDKENNIIITASYEVRLVHLEEEANLENYEKITYEDFMKLTKQ